jgi:crossover junction endodeoxyribonuclease RuvC
MIYIGIDPGKAGGYASIGNDATTPEVHPWDDYSFVAWLGEMNIYARDTGEGIVAAVEKVGAMPGNGSVSMFNFGQSYGFILGALMALNVPFQIVPPRRWKAEFGLNSDKAKSIEVCHRLFPGVSLRRTDKCRTDSDGMAESLLIAEYAHRHFGEGSV